MHAFYANRDTETESSSTDKMTALFCLDLKQHGGGVDSTTSLMIIIAIGKNLRGSQTTV